MAPGLRRRRSARGASGVEYALGVTFLLTALVVVLDGVEASADRTYDDRQELLSTPVTDGATASTTATTAASSTTVTLPATFTTTTTAPVSTTATTAATTSTTAAPTTTATTTAPATTYTAAGRVLTLRNNGTTDTWTVDVVVTSTPPSSNPVTVTWRNSRNSTGTVSCTPSAGSCTVSLPSQPRNATSATVTINGTSTTVARP